MIVLDKFYKPIYESFMKNVKFIKLNCWNIKAPPDFENHTPCEDSKDW